MLKTSSSSKPEFGCKHPPLVSLPIVHFVPDELHLMLRITDVLLRKLIDDAHKLNGDLKVKREVPVNVNKLIELIRDCGVGFAVWNNKGGELEWTSLSGTDKLKLLNHLPAQLTSHGGVISESSKQATIQLWEDFLTLCKYINDTRDSGAIIFEKKRKPGCRMS